MCIVAGDIIKQVSMNEAESAFHDHMILSF